MASVETAAQSEEIKGIKEAFPACRVISNVGQFSHVVELKQEGRDLALKLQLEDTYPSSVPDVIVKSGLLSAEDRLQLTEALRVHGEGLRGQQMLASLYQAAVSWAAEKDVDLTCGVVVKESKPREKHVKSKKQGGGSRTKAQEQHVRGSKKLVSMKTSEDVISRILWDEQLPSEHFSVGYLDRFVGVVERAFSTFTWEDIASVDYDALAIPKHRIHYFKYRGVRVWDKEARLDNMFGSTGSGLTITDVIAQYEAGELQAEEGGEVTQGQEEEDSDEEEVVIKTGLEGAMYPRDEYWGPKKRPTHFLCLRVTDAGVRGVVDRAGEDIVGLEEKYRENLIPSDRLHITLACLGLDCQEDVDRACELLHSLRPELLSLQPSHMCLTLHGVDTFFNNVLYTRVLQHPDFLAFVQRLRLLMQEGGCEIRDVFAFTPHMTLLKLKRDAQKDLRTRYIEPRVYTSLTDKLFGEQVVDNIYLCEMSENRDNVGFYVSPTHLKF